jgi:hypothetical protein
MSCKQSGGHPEGRTVNITCTGPVGKRVERSSRDTSGEDGECNEREPHFAKCVIETGFLMRLVWMAKKKKRQVLE